MPSQATLPIPEPLDPPEPVRPGDPQPLCGDYPTKPMPEARRPRPQPREEERPPLSRDDFSIID